MKRFLVLSVGLFFGVLTCCLVFPPPDSCAYTGKVSLELPVAPKYATGLTWDGKYLWACDWWEAKAYKLDPADGTVIDSIALPCTRPDDIAYEQGGYLYLCDATQSFIYKLNLASGIVEASYQGPGSSPSALACDGTNLWLADRGEKTIYKLNPKDGTALNYFPAPAGEVEGLAWDGKYLWASDRNRNELYMLDPRDGTVLMIVPSPGPYPTGIAFDGKSLWNVDFQKDTLYRLAYDDGENVYQTDPKERSVKFVYILRNMGPGLVTKAEAFLAVPEELVSQKLLLPLSYEPQPDRFDTDESGQKVAVYEYHNLGAGAVKQVGYTADVEIGVRRFCIFPHKVGSLKDVPVSVRKQFTVDASRYRLNQPLIHDTAKQIVGDETNAYWVARNIYKWVLDHVEYVRTGGWDIAETLIKRGTGSCSEYAFLYVALCREAGLPARYEGSVVVRGDDASIDDVFHRWCEVYLPGYGWVTVDPSGGDSPTLADQGRAFGTLGNRYFVTTHGGGDSKYLDWNYNYNSRYSFEGDTDVKEEVYAIWEPVE